MFGKYVRVLEVPIYLLCIGGYELAAGRVGWAIGFLILSLIRLYINKMTSDV